MRPVVIGRTLDRSVLGIMVDFAKAVPYYLEPRQCREDTLSLIEEQLAQTPCYASRGGDQVVFPHEKASDLLRAKWLADIPLKSTSGE
jgi:hypothetical protein